MSQFKMHQSSRDAEAQLNKLGVRMDDVEALIAAGLSWLQIIFLAIQFATQYGPKVFEIATAIIAALKAGTPQQVAEALAALEAKYGKDLYAMAQVIASWFGVVLPPIAPRPA